MAKKILKCLYCQQQFDANTEEYVKVNGRRYAHKYCYENRTAEQKIMDEIWDTITEIFGKNNYSAQKIKNQIENYVEKKGYTLNGILIAIKYWFIIKNKSIEEANNGIGIVPYIYNEAQEYALYLEQQKTKKIIPVSEMKTITVDISSSNNQKKTILNFEE